MLKSLVPREVKVDFRNDDNRLNWNLTTNKTFRFTGNFFFYIILGFTDSHSGEIGDFQAFIQLIPGS